VAPPVVGGTGQHNSVGTAPAAIAVVAKAPIVTWAVPAISSVTPVEVAALPLPDQVERVALAAPLPIFDADDRDAPVFARIANELHSAAAIDSLKSEIGGTLRKQAGTLEPPPLGWLARKRPDTSLVAVDFDFRDPIDNHLDRAFAAVGISSAAHDGPHGRCRLTTERNRQNRKARQSQPVSTHLINPLQVDYSTKNAKGFEPLVPGNVCGTGRRKNPVVQLMPLSIIESAFPVSPGAMGTPAGRARVSPRQKGTGRSPDF
jgi:hypothetical protein